MRIKSCSFLVFVRQTLDIWNQILIGTIFVRSTRRGCWAGRGSVGRQSVNTSLQILTSQHLEEPTLLKCEGEKKIVHALDYHPEV